MRETTEEYLTLDHVSPNRTRCEWRSRLGVAHDKSADVGNSSHAGTFGAVRCRKLSAGDGRGAVVAPMPPERVDDAEDVPRAGWVRAQRRRSSDVFRVAAGKTRDP